MTANSVEKLNIQQDKGLNLLRAYEPIKTTYTQILDSAISEFWGTGVDLSLISISKDDSYFLKGSEYFVTRIKLTHGHQFVVRIAKETVQVLLDCALGNNPDFVFEKITELEAKILTGFNNFVYEKFSEYMKTEEELENSEEEPETGDYYLTFFLKNISEEPAKIIITIPSAFMKIEEIELTNNHFDIGDFPTAKIHTGIYIGSTTLSLNEVKNIEKEDIIVLDNSNINNMTLYYEDNKIGFKVSPDPSLIVSFDNNDGSKNMSENKGNIWDNIQVDVSAEFENVKISLGELKQISEGLVIEMGSIYENKIFLKVENKIIAEGELVIINDKYGVKINTITNENEQADITSDEIIQEEADESVSDNQDEIQEEPENTSENPENTEDFDYKDFDVDDENI